jgi:hypothetical protein
MGRCGLRPPGRALLGFLLGLPLPAPGAPILISEILYDAVGSDDGGVFVELWGPPGCELEGYTLEGVNGADGRIEPKVRLTGPIPGDQFFVVADLGAGQTRVSEADLLLEFDLQNGPDSLVLRGPAGDRLDAVGYGAFGASEFFEGEGEPAPDAGPGSSLARWFANVDTDDNRTDFRVLSEPSPGFGALQIPEPSTLPLAGLAVLSLLLARCFTRLPKRNRSTPPG